MRSDKIDSNSESETHCRFYNIVGADRTPGNGSRIAFGKDFHSPAVNNQLAILGLNGPFVTPVDRVILEHVGLYRRITQDQVEQNLAGYAYHVVKINKRTAIEC
jgi:hypothetical protein